MVLRRPHPRELHSASAHAGREGCGVVGAKVLESMTIMKKPGSPDGNMWAEHEVHGLGVAPQGAEHEPMTLAGRHQKPSTRSMDGVLRTVEIELRVVQTDQSRAGGGIVGQQLSPTIRIRFEPVERS